MAANSKPQPCPRCGFYYQCICDAVPELDARWHLALLTHPNEPGRDTNTGKLLSQTLPHCQSYLWDRVNPPQTLLDKLASGLYQPFLLFPSTDSRELTEVVEQHELSDKCPYLFILLDGTWQEARKMFNRSPWLQAIPALHLSNTESSGYALRRNQKKGNLCTCEVGIKLLSDLNSHQEAEQLKSYFDYYLKVFSADKSGHKYK